MKNTDTSTVMTINDVKHAIRRRLASLICKYKATPTYAINTV